MQFPALRPDMRVQLGLEKTPQFGGPIVSAFVHDMLNYSVPAAEMQASSAERPGETEHIEHIRQEKDTSGCFFIAGDVYYFSKQYFQRGRTA